MYIRQLRLTCHVQELYIFLLYLLLLLLLHFSARCQHTEITVQTPGAKMAEKVASIKCGLDSTVFLTENGRAFACGRLVTLVLQILMCEKFLYR